MKRIIVSSLSIFPLLPLSGREILWSIMAWQMEPNRGRFIILKPFHLLWQNLKSRKSIYLQIQRVLPIGCPPIFTFFSKRLKLSKEIQMSVFFFWVMQDELVIRIWPAEHGQELCPNANFLLIAETYLSTTFDPNTSYFFDGSSLGIPNLWSIWVNQCFAISTFARIEKDNLGLNWPKL